MARLRTLIGPLAGPRLFPFLLLRVRILAPPLPYVTYLTTHRSCVFMECLRWNLVQGDRLNIWFMHGEGLPPISPFSKVRTACLLCMLTTSHLCLSTPSGIVYRWRACRSCQLSPVRILDFEPDFFYFSFYFNPH